MGSFLVGTLPYGPFVKSRVFCAIIIKRGILALGCILFVYFVAGRSIFPFIIWLCLTRTGNYQIHEFDWLKRILTVV